MTASDTRETVAFAMWKHEALRAAPNVGRKRTAEDFAGASDAERSKWLGLADAAIAAIPTVQPSPDVAALVAEIEARGIKRAESLLLGLLKGEYSSLTIGFNDDHACNYVKAEGWRDEYGFYTGDDKDRIAWVSDDEREKAIADNSVWTLQWYPRTPVGFECLGASSLSAILALIENKEQS